MFEKCKEKYKDNNDYRMLIAKISDKYSFCIQKNKITYTDFLDVASISIANEMIKEEHLDNYLFYGVRENPDRSVLIFYPSKFSIEMVEKNYNKIFNIIRIKLPNDIKYEHREYLSGIMKLGIKREKFGDIVVKDDGADIIAFEEISKILVDDLKQLTRFRKSIITIENIDSFEENKQEFEDIKIIISSNRLDNFVSELAHCSRTAASEYIAQGKVFINSINEFKDSKKININDIITIRGKGKFIFELIEKETKNNKLLVNIKKYK